MLILHEKKGPRISRSIPVSLSKCALSMGSIKFWRLPYYTYNERVSTTLTKMPSTWWRHRCTHKTCWSCYYEQFLYWIIAWERIFQFCVFHLSTTMLSTISPTSTGSFGANKTEKSSCSIQRKWVKMLSCRKQQDASLWSKRQQMKFLLTLSIGNLNQYNWIWTHYRAY